LARAIFDRISLDLRSIAFVPVEEDAESMDDEDDEESDAPAAVMVVDPTAAFEEAINGLVGDVNQLVLHVSRPSRDAEYVSLGGPVDPTMQASDLQIVTYLTAEQGGNGLSGVIGSVLPDTIDSRSQILGLARVQGDAMVMQMAQDAADNSVLAESAQLLAAEVVSIEFAYYENGAVYESWDTREYNRLPQAVEIKLGFRQDQSEFAEGSRFTTAMDAPSRIFRKVVSLPLAGAYVEETY
jgi:hypothetical protein